MLYKTITTSIISLLALPIIFSLAVTTSQAKGGGPQGLLPTLSEQKNILKMQSWCSKYTKQLADIVKTDSSIKDLATLTSDYNRNKPKHPEIMHKYDYKNCITAWNKLGKTTSSKIKLEQTFKRLMPGSYVSTKGEVHTVYGNIKRKSILEDPQLTDIPWLLEHIIKFILKLSFSLSVLFLVWGGFSYFYDMHHPGEALGSKGKTTIYHALMGMAVSILAYIAVSAIIAAIAGY